MSAPLVRACRRNGDPTTRKEWRWIIFAVVYRPVVVVVVDERKLMSEIFFFPASGWD